MDRMQQAQTSGGIKDDIFLLSDKLTGALIGLPRATEGNDHMVSDSTAAVVVEGLRATLDREHAEADALQALIERADGEKRKLVPSCYQCAAPCGRNNDYDMKRLWYAEEGICALKHRLLDIIRDTADLAYQAEAQGRKDERVYKFLYKALFAIGMDDWGSEELLPILQEAEDVKCSLLP